MTTALNIEKNDSYFPALTGIRAIAAYMVFIHHLNPFSENIFGKKIHDMADELLIGVTLFFVLSGFLITVRYYSTEKLDLKRYLFNRFARIYPMYFILVSALFAAHAIFKHQHNSGNLISYLLNVSLLKGLFAEYKFSGISQSWSLTVEEMFYFTAPLSFWCIRRSRWTLIILPVLLTGMGYGLIYTLGRIIPHGFMIDGWFMFWYTFFGRSAEFFAGIALALFYFKFRNRLKTKYATLSGLLLILLSIYALSMLRSGTWLGIASPWGILINNLLLPLFGIAVFYWGLITERGPIQRLLSSRIFILLGQSSYIFYLVHYGLIHSLSRFNFLFIFVLSNVVSVLLYKLMEAPIHKWLQALWPLNPNQNAGQTTI